MNRYNITFLFTALLFMNFQCEQTPHTPLTIVNLSLVDNCTDDQEGYTSTLYMDAQEGFVPVEEKSGDIGTPLVFQYTSFLEGFIKLQPTNSECRSSWYKINKGKRQTITLNYSSEQPVNINLISQPSDTMNSLSFEILRMHDGFRLFGDEDEVKVNDLNVEDFPLTDYVLSTSSSYRFIIFEHTDQGKVLLADRMIETGADGAEIEVEM